MPAPNERTTAAVGTIAGQLLNGRHFKAAEEWLNEVAANPTTTDDARGHALVLIGTIQNMRRVAASALTQRPSR